MTLEMPSRIAALDRDSRGYPIPYIILYDKDGRPQFAVNDNNKLWKATNEGLCHICGQELDQFPWFVGGPGSALLNGNKAIYHDGPMHHECMHFALKICPYLLQELRAPLNMMPVRNKLESQGVATFDNTMIPGIPRIFVAVQGWRQFEVIRLFNDTPEFYVHKPFRKIEYWQNGQMIDAREGEKLAKKFARELLVKLSLEKSKV